MLQLSLLQKQTLAKNYLVDNKVFESKGAGRRLIAQNGVSIGDDKWTDVEKVLTAEDLANGDMIVRKGKKKFYRLIKA